jgi:hypothetical protein
MKPKIKLINKKGVLKINEYPINNIKKTIRFTSYYNNPTTFIGSGRSIKSYNRIKPEKINQSENLENIYYPNKINTSNNLNNNRNNNYQYYPSLTDSICSNNQSRIKSELINPKNTLLNKMINLKNNNNSVENNYNDNDNNEIIINEND